MQKPMMGRKYVTPQGELTPEGYALLASLMRAIEDLTKRVEALEP